MPSKLPFRVGEPIDIGPGFTIKAVASVEEEIEGMVFARCLLLIQKATGELELSFTYASHEKNQPEWDRGKGHYTYVNMRPETLVKLIIKAVTGECEGSFEPARSHLRVLAMN